VFCSDEMGGNRMYYTRPIVFIGRCNGEFDCAQVWDAVSARQK